MSACVAGPSAGLRRGRPQRQAASASSSSSSASGSRRPVRREQPQARAAAAPVKLHEVIEISSDEDEDRVLRPPPGPACAADRARPRRALKRRSHRDGRDSDDDFQFVAAKHSPVKQNKAKGREDEAEKEVDDEKVNEVVHHVLGMFPELDLEYARDVVRQELVGHECPAVERVPYIVTRLLQNPRKPDNNEEEQQDRAFAEALAESEALATSLQRDDRRDADLDEKLDANNADGATQGKGKGRAREEDDEEDAADSPQRKRARVSGAAVEEDAIPDIPLSGPSGIECPVCCEDDVEWAELIQCPEGHLFCKECCKRQAENLLGVRNCNFKCMDFEGCDFLFSDREVKKFLSEKSFELYENIKQEIEVNQAGIESLESCPFCPYSVDMGDVPDETLFRCENEACRKVSCRACKDPDHSPKTCAEHAHSKIADPQRRGEEALSAALMRFCPKCKAAIVKDAAAGGCNKMRCNCGALMCYVCRKDITREGYDHFDRQPGTAVISKQGACKLWEDTRERHRKELAAVRKQLGKDAPVEKGPAEPAGAGPAGYLNPRNWVGALPGQGLFGGGGQDAGVAAAAAAARIVAQPPPPPAHQPLVALQGAPGRLPGPGIVAPPLGRAPPPAPAAGGPGPIRGARGRYRAPDPIARRPPPPYAVQPPPQAPQPNGIRDRLANMLPFGEGWIFRDVRPPDANPPPPAAGFGGAGLPAPQLARPRPIPPRHRPIARAPQPAAPAPAPRAAAAGPSRPRTARRRQMGQPSPPPAEPPKPESSRARRAARRAASKDDLKES
ncbi:hypothetical protein V8E36_002567 [Tilletia maclaganii]